jgi:23S rRNA pseudouridine2605 synthase
VNERLNKYLALHLGISRREADDLIAGGHVTVDDHVATLGKRLESTSTVLVKGTPLDGHVSFGYLALHKPIGYVSSRRQQGDSPTLYSLLPEDLHHLKPVGRLDRETSGLILLTNDGDFAYQMTHPKFYKTKEYDISLDKPLAPLHQQIISDHGIQLDDGPSKLILERQDDSLYRHEIAPHQVWCLRP